MGMSIGELLGSIWGWYGIFGRNSQEPVADGNIENLRIGVFTEREGFSLSESQF